MQRSLCFAALLLVLAATGSAQVVVINEFDLGTPEWFEIANLDPLNPADVSGFVFTSTYDNPVGLTPETITLPGAVGSGTTIIPARGTLVISESSTAPVLPAGVQRITGIVFPYFSGLPGTATLVDPVTNTVVDEVAWSNDNAFQWPVPAGFTGTPGWVGDGFPVYSDGVTTVKGGANGNFNYRHDDIDDNDASDWTTSSVTASSTPGVLNHGQLTNAECMTSGTCTPLTPGFSTNSTCGTAPLTVTFNNETLGEEQTFLVQWDIVDTSGPTPVATINEHHAFFTFTSGGTFDVTLQMADITTGSVTTVATTIQVNPPTLIQAQPVPPATGHAECFENMPTITDVCTGLTAPDPVTGFEFRGLDPGSRIRIIDRTSVAVTWSFPAASASSGDTVVLLDTTSGLATNELAFYIDSSQFPGNEVKLRFALLENNDEIHSQDVVALCDGVTVGNGIDNALASTGAPGFNGLQEFALPNDLNNVNPVSASQWQEGLAGTGGIGVGNRAWHTFEVDLDAAFYAANPTFVPGGTYILVFRQRDNVTFEGNDGLAIDCVEAVALNPVAGPGQPGVLGVSSLDVNGARNANQNVVGEPADQNGPHFVNAPMGIPLNFTVTGEVGAGIVLVSSPFLNPNAFSAPGVGQLDIGQTNPSPPFIPTFITVVADGTAVPALGFNALFSINAAGDMQFSVPANLPPGTDISFQCFLTSTLTPPGVLSNAVQVSVF